MVEIGWTSLIGWETVLQHSFKHLGLTFPNLIFLVRRKRYEGVDKVILVLLQSQIGSEFPRDIFMKANAESLRE